MEKMTPALSNVDSAALALRFAPTANDIATAQPITPALIESSIFAVGSFRVCS